MLAARNCGLWTVIRGASFGGVAMKRCSLATVALQRSQRWTTAEDCWKPSTTCIYGQRATKCSNISHNSPRILVTGSCGQVGTELLVQLREKYGAWNVIGTDVIQPSRKEVFGAGPFAYGNVLEYRAMEKLVVEHDINWVIHNSSILSAKGEQNLELAFQINFMGLKNMLELARHHKLRIFVPSSIAAFGPSTPLDFTPNITIQRPTTIYGISKVFAELMGEYYHTKFGVDFRSLRYPGIISVTLPGGGTTDYAVQIFFDALKTGKYTCFLKKDTRLPMMYMPDCIKGTMDFIDAPEHLLKSRTYNLSAFSFTPEELATEIRRHIPDLEVDYQPDFRQGIADTWPKVFDDSEARKDWGWDNAYKLSDMVDDLLPKVKEFMANRAAESEK